MTNRWLCTCLYFHLVQIRSKLKFPSWLATFILTVQRRTRALLWFATKKNACTTEFKSTPHASDYHLYCEDNLDASKTTKSMYFLPGNINKYSCRCRCLLQGFQCPKGLSFPILATLAAASSNVVLALPSFGIKSWTLPTMASAALLDNYTAGNKCW